MDADSTVISRKARIAGRIVSGVVTLFFLADGGAKLFRPEPVVKGTLELGYSESVIVPLGIVLLACTLLYALPRTAFVGAILLTGYLGGAVDAHVRHGDPLLTHTLFPIYFGVLVWLGLWLRDARVRAATARRTAVG
jgi:hypothetical protein